MGELFAEIVAFVVEMAARITTAAVAPLRFLFSHKYRRAKLDSWKGRPWEGAANFTAGALALLLFLSMVGFFIWLFAFPKEKKRYESKGWIELMRKVERLVPSQTPGKN